MTERGVRCGVFTSLDNSRGGSGLFTNIGDWIGRFIQSVVLGLVSERSERRVSGIHAIGSGGSLSPSSSTS